MSAATARKFEDQFAAAEPVSIWSSPDMSVLTAGRRPAPAIPEEMFGPIWPLLKDLAIGAGAPVDFTAISFLTVSASLVGGKRRVRPYAECDWAEPCILWSALVGEPSWNKSPALRRFSSVLRTMEAGYAEKHTENLLTWQGDVERAKVERSLWQNMVKEAAENGLPHPPMPAVADEPVTPERRRLYVQDATPESVGAVLSGNPAGTLCIRDELAGWLNFDRYSSGGGGREFWLEAYGGDSYTIDRKSNAKPIVIQFNGVSVCGGIQPDKLSETLLGKGAPNDGLVARFLWAWPDEPAFERPRRAADNSDLVNVFSRLDGLGWGTGLDGRDVPVTIPLSTRAADLFEEFQRENRRCPTDAGPLFKAFVGKLDGMALRIALAVELAQWAYLGGQEPTEISVQTIARVAEFLDSYAKPSALRVFGDAALPVNERNAATLARYILREKVTAFNARALRRAARLPGMKDADSFNEAVSLLVDADWLRDAGKRDGGGPGRRTSDFVVNTVVHGGA